MATQPSWSPVEDAARTAYGRLVALLAARSGDLAGAEDALGDALVAALERWPRDGVPANPQAWLMTVARRRRIDLARRRVRAGAALAELGRMRDEAEAREPDGFPDARLGLLLACAHPAIDASARTPLMLQAVLGLTAERLASAFLVSPSTMTKRLVRAKAKLAGAGVGFTVPDREALPDRMEPVLDAVYAAFTLARDDGGNADLESEALWLGRLLAELAPDEPEAMGLLALMLFVSARTRPAPDASYTPLSRQDPAGWDTGRLVEAEALLRGAGRAGRPGRFQLEAAIQAVHADRRRSGRTDWPSILVLYEGLVSITQALGAQVGRAAALAQSGDPVRALKILDALDPARIVAHQPYWATRAHVLARAGRGAEAADAYRRAAGLTEQTGLRRWLLDHAASLS